MFEKMIEQMKALTEQCHVRIDPPREAMSRWKPEIQAAANDDTTINIYDIIGEDYWTGDGMTAKIVSGVLNRNKGKAITVNINSPGGSFFEGVAIYNLLKSHDADVNVRIIGIAASAASIVAMAGTNIQIAESGFLMIHNAWTIAMGNKSAMREVADTLAQFDESMAGVYSKKTGIDADEVKEMLDEETWISGKDAIDMGFANSFLDSDTSVIEASEKTGYNSSLKKIDTALAKAGMPRSERRNLVKELFASKPSATEEQEEAMPGAGDAELNESLNEILNKIRS